jgi:translation initiation factor 4E
MGDPSATMEVSSTTEVAASSTPLGGKWTLWAHLPHDTDWSISSYKEIHTFDTVEGAISTTEVLPDKMVKNCMLFLMRQGVHPTWEDPNNRDGGCFSYRVGDRQIVTTWKDLTYALVGETLSQDARVQSRINGITISPKKNFSVMKVWLRDCTAQNPAVIQEIHGVVPRGCLFKRHSPEY